jgi:hypothetical protein
MDCLLFFKYDARRQSGKTGILGDILDHADSSYGGSDLVTEAHESTHLINNQIRQISIRPNCNGFYCLNDRAILLKEPNFKKSQIIPFIPDEYKGNDLLYKLYIMGQPAWEDQPLYVLDEYVAYLNGTICGLELAEQGKSLGNQKQTVKGIVWFSKYAAALWEAVLQLDPDYEDKYRLRDFLKWLKFQTDMLVADAERYENFRYQE